MICFHFRIFEPLETVAMLVELPSKGCDLLSFFYLWTIGNSKISLPGVVYCVVICFHFSIFEPLETVLGTFSQTVCELWFAFILVSLNHWKQFKGWQINMKLSCDLLSFHYLWTIGNSVFYSEKGYLNVVICFHFSIFEPLETVNTLTVGLLASCDLLSF